MRKFGCTLMMLLTATLVAQAQNPRQNRTPMPGMRAVTPAAPALKEAEKLRFLVAQLNLDPEQTEHAEGLLAVFESQKGQILSDVQSRLPEIQAKSQELEQALKEGNQARADAIRKELQDMVSLENAEREFFDNLKAKLTDEQKQTLEQAIARLERHPGGVLRPWDVFKIGEMLVDSDDQKSRLAEIKDGFRQKINNLIQYGDVQRRAALDQLIADVRAILNEQQAATFDQKVNALRIENARASGAANGKSNQSGQGGQDEHAGHDHD